MPRYFALLPGGGQRRPLRRRQAEAVFDDRRQGAPAAFDRAPGGEPSAHADLRRIVRSRRPVRGLRRSRATTSWPFAAADPRGQRRWPTRFACSRMRRPTTGSSFTTPCVPASMPSRWRGWSRSLRMTASAACLPSPRRDAQTRRRARPQRAHASRATASGMRRRRRCSASASCARRSIRPGLRARHRRGASGRGHGPASSPGARQQHQREGHLPRRPAPRDGNSRHAAGLTAHATPGDVYVIWQHAADA